MKYGTKEFVEVLYKYGRESKLYMHVDVYREFPGYILDDERCPEIVPRLDSKDKMVLKLDGQDTILFNLMEEAR